MSGLGCGPLPLGLHSSISRASVLGKERNCIVRAQCGDRLDDHLRRDRTRDGTWQCLGTATSCFSGLPLIHERQKRAAKTLNSSMSLRTILPGESSCTTSSSPPHSFGIQCVVEIHGPSQRDIHHAAPRPAAEGTASPPLLLRTQPIGPMGLPTCNTLCLHSIDFLACPLTPP